MNILPAGFFSYGKPKDKRVDKPNKLTIREGKSPPEGYVMTGQRTVSRGDRGTDLIYNTYTRQQQQAAAPVEEPAATSTSSAVEPYTPVDIEGLINSAISAAMPDPEPPLPPPPPTFINSSPSLVPTQPLSVQANTPSKSRGGAFQRRGASNLKINQSLNV